MKKSDVAFENFEEFWAFYLKEHSQPETQQWHVAGTVLAAGLVAAGLLGKRRLLLPAGVAVAYGFAWWSHWRVEKNRPASFRHPVWSLRGDVRMVGRWVRGRLAAKESSC